MPKDFGSIFSGIKGRKVSLFWANLVDFRVQKVICCLYHSGTVRHFTVNYAVGKLSDIRHLNLRLLRRNQEIISAGRYIVLVRQAPP